MMASPDAPLEQVLESAPPGFALLHRPEVADPGSLDVLVGDVAHVATLADIPMPDRRPIRRSRTSQMMTRICEPGVRVTGPQLKEMARLAHTEYFIEGHSSRDVRDILRETMFAPTVTGSPLENACRIIRRHEPAGRGYYSGIAALIGRDASGDRTLDSSILIRTADSTTRAR